MSPKEFDEIVKILVRETEIIFAGQPVKISPDAPLASLGFDSMSFVELLVSIEKNFKVKLIEVGMRREDLKTLETLARCIHRVT